MNIRSYMDTYHVGDIVVCRTSYAKTDGKRGFIEEIVDEPTPQRTGRYSVYGLEIPNNDKDEIYYGDYSPIELEKTGKVMTSEDILEYKATFHDNVGLQHDMDRVIEKIEGLVVN